LTEAIVQEAQLRQRMRVLDLASGAGEPALSLAQAVGPGGHVSATDVSPGMVATIAEMVRQQGLKNLTCQQADAEALPFAGQTFDVVTSRLGTTPHPDRALQEAYRVLKRGGRIALVVWGAREEQGFITSTIALLAKYVPMPPSQPGSPDPFGFATPGSLSALMKRVGFREVQEETRRVTMSWTGSPELFLEFGAAIAPEFGARLAELSADQREQLFREQVGALRRYDDGRQLNMPAAIVMASGVR
jgi:ubiquinone/menaquinone biosynthesis C-methylase UbiE